MEVSAETSSAAVATRHVVLTGNPNCGKTTLFNALTGLHAKVGNYAGVTVERKEGRLLGAPKAAPVTVLDLPGTYSLSPQSLDEQISRDVLRWRLKTPASTGTCLKPKRRCAARKSIRCWGNLRRGWRTKSAIR